MTMTELATRPVAPSMRPSIATIPTAPGALLADVTRLFDDGWRLVTASAIRRERGHRVLYHFERADELHHLALELEAGQAVPSIASVYPGAFLVENEMAELQGVKVSGLEIDYGGHLYRDFDEVEPVAPHETTPGSGEVATVVPFGPQHPVLAEPIQLELTLRDETVVGVVPGLGYVHRGIEAASESRSFAADLPLLERVCGICSVAHAVAYAQAIEALAGVEIPRRAKLLRTFWFELTRIHSHLLWLGLAADAIGFEALFQSCWRIRERVLDLFALTAGNRVILGVVALGGVRRDIPPDMRAQALEILDEVERGLGELTPFVVGNEATTGRLAGVAPVPHDEARVLGLVGPTVRASGVGIDVRTSGYAAHGELPFAPIVEETGDALARTVVRWREVFDSLRLCRESLARLAGLPWQLGVRVPDRLSGEATSRVEAPRGELFYYVTADGGTHPTRVRVRTPTFANLAAVIHMLPGTQMAAVPVGLLSIDPCLSCTER
jgi:NADH-quinone oxidoreductase subunit D